MMVWMDTSSGEEAGEEDKDEEGSEDEKEVVWVDSSSDSSIENLPKWMPLNEFKKVKKYVAETESHAKTAMAQLSQRSAQFRLKRLQER